MFRWCFLVLLVANLFPALMAGNRDLSSDTLAVPPASSVSLEAYRVKPIVLLSEKSSDMVASADESEETANLLPQRREERCFLIGPLAAITTSERYAEVLERANVEFNRHWREVAVGSDYWIYLPKLPSTRATTRTLQELKASKIDGFIFSDGELKGAVALAVTTDRAAAEQKRSEFAELGYDARVHQMNRLAREYWLMSENVPRPGVMIELAKSESAAEIPQKISRMGCETVASAMEFQ